MKTKKVEKVITTLKDRIGHPLTWFRLNQFRPRQRPILSQNKVISGKDDCSTT